MFYLKDKKHLILIIDNLTLELWNYSTKELLKKIKLKDEKIVAFFKGKDKSLFYCMQNDKLKHQVLFSEFKID